MREILISEASVHCGRLKGRFEAVNIGQLVKITYAQVVLQLLAFCVSDESEVVGVFARQHIILIEAE